MKSLVVLTLIAATALAQTEGPPTMRRGGYAGSGPPGIARGGPERTPEPAVSEYTGPRSTVSGTVIDALTGTPVKSARVHLFPAAQRRTDGTFARMGPTRPITATTGADGRFTALNLEPGTYMVNAIHPRYSTSRRGPRPESVVVRPGESKEDLVLRLTPGGVVAGRVLDQDGDAIPHAPVTVLTSAGVDSGVRLQPVGNASTNDVGEYRIHGLREGKYYIYVRPTRPALMPTPLLPKGQPALITQAYQPVFYPGSTDPATATLVNVTPGTEVTGIDFRLGLTAVSTIKGIIAGPPELTRMPVQIQLVPRESAVSVDVPGGYTLARNGSFELPMVTPGMYRVRAQSISRENQFSGSVDITVRADRPLETIIIPLVPAAEVTGRFVLEGGTMPPGMHASLQPKEGNFRAPHPHGKLEPDGSFRFRALPGTYSLPAHFGSVGYVKSVTMNGQPADPDSIVVGEGGGVLDVFLSPKTAVIEGTLNGEIPGNVMIVAYPESGSRERPLTTMAIPGSSSFTLRSMPPGRYRVAAVAGDSAAFDPRSRKVYEAVQKHGTMIALVEEDRKTLTLRVVDLNP